MTQLEEVQNIIRKYFRSDRVQSLSEQQKAIDRLKDLLGQAQNAPPEGVSDGSLDQHAWEALRDVIRGYTEMHAGYSLLVKNSDALLVPTTDGRRANWKDGAMPRIRLARKRHDL